MHCAYDLLLKKGENIFLSLNLTSRDRTKKKQIYEEEAEIIETNINIFVRTEKKENIFL